MFAATRRWFRRNRTPLAIGVGVVGAGYVVTQYVLSRINDARERMSSDRIAKEKYDDPLAFHTRPNTSHFVACVGVSNRTRRIAPSPCSPCCRLRRPTSSTP
jgi:hypothetical protein